MEISGIYGIQDQTAIGVESFKLTIDTTGWRELVQKYGFSTAAEQVAGKVLNPQWVEDKMREANVIQGWFT